MKKREVAINEALRERNKTINHLLDRSKYRPSKQNQSPVEELEQIIRNQNHLIRTRTSNDPDRMNKDGALSEFIYRDASTPSSVQNEEKAMKELASTYS